MVVNADLGNTAQLPESITDKNLWTPFRKCIGWWRTPQIPRARGSEWITSVADDVKTWIRTQLKAIFLKSSPPDCSGWCSSTAFKTVSSPKEPMTWYGCWKVNNIAPPSPSHCCHEHRDHIKTYGDLVSMKGNKHVCPFLICFLFVSCLSSVNFLETEAIQDAIINDSILLLKKQSKPLTPCEKVIAPWDEQPINTIKWLWKNIRDCFCGDSLNHFWGNTTWLLDF